MASSSGSGTDFIAAYRQSDADQDEEAKRHPYSLRSSQQQEPVAAAGNRSRMSLADVERLRRGMMAAPNRAVYPPYWPALLGHSPVRAEHVGHCGLVNLGNTCFMNSTLQCLTHLPDLRDYFLYQLHTLQLQTTNPLGSGGRVAKAFAEVVQAIYSGNQSFSPRSFKVCARFALRSVWSKTRFVFKQNTDGHGPDLSAVLRLSAARLARVYDLSARQDARGSESARWTRRDGYGRGRGREVAGFGA